MKNFIFKSTNADLQKMFQSIETIQKNVLYSTYRIDMILKILNKMETDKGLQKQVDDYFEEDAEEKAEEVPETSPQTDSDEQ